MTKFKVLSTALVAATMLAAPATARTGHVTSHIIAHSSQAEASTGRYKFRGYVPTAPQQNINQDLSRYGGELAPEVLKP